MLTSTNFCINWAAAIAGKVEDTRRVLRRLRLVRDDVAGDVDGLEDDDNVEETSWMTTSGKEEIGDGRRCGLHTSLKCTDPSLTS